MKDRETIVENYIAGYNAFNIEQMVKDMDEAVQFKNVQDENITMELNGIDEFIAQATHGFELFPDRTQTILSIRHSSGAVEIEIAYRAVAAQDMPNGLKKGQEFHMTGTSVFTFNKENRITSLTDIS